MISSPGIMQLPLINARATGDGDAKLPPWPRGREFMGLVVAPTLGSGVSLDGWLRVVPGRPGLVCSPRPCRVPGLSLLPSRPLPCRKSAPGKASLLSPLGLTAPQAFQGRSKPHFCLEPHPHVPQNPSLGHSHSSAGPCTDGH